jgi:Leucine-rich repeat (LRR) protein
MVVAEIKSKFAMKAFIIFLAVSLVCSNSIAQKTFYSIEAASQNYFDDEIKLYLNQPKNIDSLEHISNLVSLELHNTLIKNFDGLLRNSKELKTLKLVDCRLSEISLNQINQLISIEHIALTSCNLMQFPEKILLINQLKSLDLSNNFIANVPCYCFNHPTLLNLNVSNNKIYFIDDCPKIEHYSILKNLDLSNNQISDFPLVLNYLDNLRTLNLGRNKIGIISSDIHLPSSITFLGLADNYLKIFDFNSLSNTNIETLSLSGNLISEINLTNDNNLNSLKNFFISSNNIVNFTLKELPQLQELRINDNQIEKIELINLSHLEKLDISGCLDSTIKFCGLANLKELKMNGVNVISMTSLDFKSIPKLSILWLKHVVLTVEIMDYLKKMPFGSLVILTNNGVNTNEWYSKMEIELKAVGIDVSWELSHSQNPK